jgi:hypothetical protein
MKHGGNMKPMVEIKSEESCLQVNEHLQYCGRQLETAIQGQPYSLTALFTASRPTMGTHQPLEPLLRS